MGDIANMGSIAFSITTAAAATGIDPRDIERAIRERKLAAKRVSDRPVIAAPALAAWIDTLPDWYSEAD